MTESIQAISQIAATALISSIWQGVLLAAMIWVCMKLAPRTAAGSRFVIWMAVFAAISMLPMLSVFASRDGSTYLPASSHSAVHALLLDSRWAIGIVALWAIFSAGRAIGLARNAFRLASLWKRCTPIDATVAIASRLAQTSIRRARLCASPDVDQPCVIGFLAPRILIPDWLLEKATSAELEQIVLHEVTHLQRFDDWTNLVQKVALVCFPLNPALIWVERRLCSERESACDEGVVRATHAPREYAACLANLAEQRLARASATLSLGAWERRSQLAARIESILSGAAGLSPLKARAVMAALILATAGSTVKLGGTVQLVSFTSPQDVRPFAQTNQETMTGARYQDVVFHAPSASTVMAAKPVLPGNLEAAHRVLPMKQPHLRPVTKNSLRRANSPVGGVESFTIVTRWQSSSGEQLTVIDHFVRITALSAAQSQTGWFVVQL
jgi:beta-lactamase regulating signal transducer with metallopeptidase domain